ncbi:MAG TPA: prenyltransferase/squalene oxidase repeat-containing protein, partial [Rhodocyclaceae bacterium]|nr:prenyltransferase/squalene oxidase repeat-containing protein [Rhodocyclaceae bacterium]
CFGYRDGGGRKKAVGRFGGSQATESSVEAALRWLARHQEKDGSWDARKYEATAGGSDNTRIRVGCTGLALLAFLGAGYTEKSGPFADNVARAEHWLMKQQKPNGMIAEVQSGGGEIAAGYNHAVAGLALAEAYGMGKNAEIGQVAQKAVDYSVKTHQVAYGGWRYDAKQEGDTSVTGWFVMQLKSAKIAGLQVDGAGFQGAMKFLDGVTDKEGRACYGPDGHTTKSSSMTAVGMVCRQFMGAANTDPLLVKQAEMLAAKPPKWVPQNGIHDPQEPYYWYYGTLAMFQMGGRYWEAWNATLKPTLVNNQCKANGQALDGSAADKDGSWDADSGWGPTGGRVYHTAINALSLEVYYRYLPMYTK